MKTSFTVLVAGCLLLSACEKEGKTERKPITPTSVNLLGSYKIVKVIGRQGTSAPLDITESYYPELCERDDIYTFKNENVYDRTDAGMRCSPATTQSLNWRLMNPTTLVIDGEQASIDLWNGKNLHLTTDYGGGVQVSFHYLKQIGQ